MVIKIGFSFKLVINISNIVIRQIQNSLKHSLKCSNSIMYFEPIYYGMESHKCHRNVVQVFTIFNFHSCMFFKA